MSKPISFEEEGFLSLLLKSYFRNGIFEYKGLINYEKITDTIEFFLRYFDSHDRVGASNHSNAIRLIFTETKEACLSKLEISAKTLTRYKHKYLLAFKRMLFQENNNLGEACATDATIDD